MIADRGHERCDTHPNYAPVRTNVSRGQAFRDTHGIYAPACAHVRPGHRSRDAHGTRARSGFVKEGKGEQRKAVHIYRTWSSMRRTCNI